MKKSQKNIFWGPPNPPKIAKIGFWGGKGSPKKYVFLLSKIVLFLFYNENKALYDNLKNIVVFWSKFRHFYIVKSVPNKCCGSNLVIKFKMKNKKISFKIKKNEF